MKLIEICKNRKVYIQTHNFPDPDAIASAFGLQQFLAHFGIESTLCHEGNIDKLSSTKLISLCGITMYPYDEIKDEMNEDDYIILVDCQKNSGNTTDLVGDEIAAIDHHPTTVEIEYKYTDFRIVGACASIIASYFKEHSIKPDTMTATALMYGLRMDTAFFSRNVTAFDVSMYSYLFEYSDAELLHKLETNNMEFSDLSAYEVAIKNIQVYGKVGFSYLNFPCPDALIAILSDFILSLVEVEVAIVYSERSDCYKFSIRSERDDVHAGVLAHNVLAPVGSGGGHAVMAGGIALKSKLTAGDDVYTTVRELFMDVIEKDYPEALK